MTWCDTDSSVSKSDPDGSPVANANAYDVVVVGGGHDSLVAASHLARR
jgi:ribulose 1,5-bisphosphate synthetase/thiazole synthase